MTEPQQRNLHVWIPGSGSPTPRAVIALVHGFAEHGARYGHVVAELAQRGIATVAVDLSGHGRSPGPRGHIDRFVEYHADVDALLRTCADRCPELPVFLLGHSMGGLVVLDRWIAQPPVRVRGVILSSPFLGMANPVSRFTHALVRTLSRIFPRLPLPTKIDGSIVCRDEVLRREYDEDPLIFYRTTARWFVEVHRAMERVPTAPGLPKDPLLILAAGDDHVVSLDRTRELARAHGVESSLVEYPDFYHEILNEPLERRRRVIDRIAEWVDARLGEAAPAD